MSNAPSSGDFPCSQVASAWRRPKPSAPARISTRTDVVDVLSRLVDKSLVPSGDRSGGRTRYRFLETIREYAGERLSEAGESSGIRRRHAEYYLRLAEAGRSVRCAARGQSEWLRRLDQELDNFRAALAWAQEEDPGLGLRLAADSRRLLVHSRRGEGRKGLARPVPGSVCRRHTVSPEGPERRRAPRLRPGRDRGRPSTAAAEHRARGDRAGPAQPRDGTELPGTAGSRRFHRVRRSRRESTSRERSPSPASSETDPAKDSPSGISATTSTTASATSFAAPSCSSDRWTSSSRWVTA